MGFTFDFKKEHLAQMIPGNLYLDDWYDALCNVLPKYEINTPQRVAAFIAQCAHESNGFKVLKENLNYRAETLRKVFPKYFPTDDLARHYASLPNKQEAIANRVYGNRMGNGDEASGDGFRYCGRGLIQLTGKNNYSAFANSLDMNINDVPEYLTTFEGAVQSACWFWETNKLNQWADAGDILTLTKRINGGTIGLEDRIKHYNHALHVLSPTHQVSSKANTVLRRGSSGEQVILLQTRLGIKADGNFGPGTERALMEWQRNNGLVADGIAGPVTMSKLIG